MKLFGSIPLSASRRFVKTDVLAGVGGLVLEQDGIPRHAHRDGDPRELIGLRLAPQALREGAEPTGEDQERRPSFEEQLCATLGDAQVVAAEDEDGVRLHERLIELKVAPDLLDQRLNPGVHPLS